MDSGKHYQNKTNETKNYTKITPINSLTFNKLLPHRLGNVKQFVFLLSLFGQRKSNKKTPGIIFEKLRA